MPVILLLVAGLTFAVGRAAKRELAAPVAESAPEPAPPPARNPSWDDPRSGIVD